MLKKQNIILLFCLLALLIVCIMAFLHNERLVDCRGEVKSINYDEAERCYYIRVLGTADGAEYLIRATPSTRVTDGGKKSSVEKIRVGNVLSLNYRGKWKSKDTVLKAKWIVIDY